MSKRTFTARVAGVEYEIPTTMAVLNEAEGTSGESLMNAFANNRFGFFLQGAIYAGLKGLGITEIEGEKLSYDLIGEVCDFREGRDNYLAFMRAMAPDVQPAAEKKPAKGKKGRLSKNAQAEEPKV